MNWHPPNTAYKCPKLNPPKMRLIILLLFENQNNPFKSADTPQSIIYSCSSDSVNKYIQANETIYDI